MIFDWILINRILVGLISTSGIFLAFWVYFADRKNKINRIFLGFILSTVIWTSLDFAVSFPSLFPYALLMARMEWAMIAIFFIFAYFFSIYFPKESKRYPALDKIVVSVEIISVFLSLFTDTIIKTIEPSSSGGAVFILGQGGIIDLIIMVPFTILVLVNIIKKYFTLSQLEKLRVQYFLIGLSICVIANLIFNVGLMLFTKVSQNISYLGTSSIIFLFGFTAYAIVKRHLFNIKVIATESLTVAIWIFLLIRTIISNGPREILTNSVLLILVVAFGIVLIKSVLNEVKQRERLERVSADLNDLKTNLEAKVVQQTAEIKKAYEVEKKARIELEELDKNKDQFILVTQHHLRTPLTIIKGYLDVLKDRFALPKEALITVDKMRESAETIANSVNDLLRATETKMKEVDK